VTLSARKRNTKAVPPFNVHVREKGIARPTSYQGNIKEGIGNLMKEDEG